MDHYYDYVYDAIFAEYKDYITKNSKYSPKVVKTNSNTSSHFPLISCVLVDNTDTDHCTNDRIERYENFYFTINIYTKNKTKGANVVEASEVINEELSKLTMQFFGGKLNMRKTRNTPTPNLDTSVLRRTIQYSCMIGNVRGNIIRR